RRPGPRRPRSARAPRVDEARAPAGAAQHPERDVGAPARAPHADLDVVAAGAERDREARHARAIATLVAVPPRIPAVDADARLAGRFDDHVVRAGRDLDRRAHDLDAGASVPG